MIDKTYLTISGRNLVFKFVLLFFSRFVIELTSFFVGEKKLLSRRSFSWLLITFEKLRFRVGIGMVRFEACAESDLFFWSALRRCGSGPLNLTDCGFGFSLIKLGHVKIVKICTVVYWDFCIGQRTCATREASHPLKSCKISSSFVGSRIRIHNPYANPDLGHSPKRLPVFFRIRTHNPCANPYLGLGPKRMPIYAGSGPDP